MRFSYGKQTIDSEDIRSVIKVLKSDWLTQGPSTKEFEKKLNQYFGGKYCSVVSNGTNALFLAGLSLNWQKNDIVITSPLTFLASVNDLQPVICRKILKDYHKNHIFVIWYVKYEHYCLSKF